MQLRQLIQNGQALEQEYQKQRQQEQPQQQEQTQEEKPILQQAEQYREPFNLNVLLNTNQTTCNDLMTTLHLYQNNKQTENQPKQDQTTLQLTVIENKYTQQDYLQQFVPFYDKQLVQPNDYIVNSNYIRASFLELERSVLNTTYYIQQEQLVTLANKTLRSQQFFRKCQCIFQCKDLEEAYDQLFKMDGQQSLQFVVDFAMDIFQKHYLLQQMPQKQPATFIQSKTNSSSALLQLFVTILLAKLQGGIILQDPKKKFVDFRDLK